MRLLPTRGFVRPPSLMPIATMISFGRVADAERAAFLFELYRKYTSGLPADGIPASKRTAGKKRPA